MTDRDDVFDSSKLPENRCPKCEGLSTQKEHRPGVLYRDSVELCEFWCSGKRWWRRLTEDEIAIEQWASQ